VYGGIGSGAIGFTSDIDCIFLYDGEKREEYDQLHLIFKNEFGRICDLDLDESFLPYHINFFYLGKYEGESIISFKDFLQRTDCSPPSSFITPGHSLSVLWEAERPWDVLEPR
jgi:hypothetical protein